MKDMLNQMLKVRNVIKLLLFLLTSCVTCKIENIDKKNNSWYSLEKFKSKKNETKIVFNSYDFHNKKEKIPATFVINKVLLNSRIIYIWSGKHTMEIVSYAKLPLKICNLRVNKGDSIVIKSYLKDSNFVIDD